MAQFLTELRKLAEHCEFGNYLDEALRDRLICGLWNEATQHRLLAEAGLTLATAYEISQSMEAARRQAGELRSSSYPQDLKYVAVPQAGGKWPCFRCGKTNHSPEKCYYKDQKCRACGKRGHIAKMCRQGRDRENQTFQPQEEAYHKAAFVESQGSDHCENEEALFAVKAVHD